MAIPAQAIRQDTLLHWPQFTETTNPREGDLAKLALLAQAELQSTLSKRLVHAGAFPVDNSLCDLASPYYPASDSLGPIPEPSDACVSDLQVRKADYLLFVTAVVVDRSPCLHEKGCEAGGYRAVLPRVRMQMALYDVKARKELQAIEASQLFPPDRYQHKMTLLGFYQKAFAAIPIDNQLAKAYREAKGDFHEALELSWGRWGSSAKGDFWELRYVQGAWNASLSMASLDRDAIYENRALNLVGWWNPFITQGGWRWGFHAGPNLNIVKGDSLAPTEKRSLGWGYEAGTHLDYVIGLGLTAGVRFGYSGRHIGLGPEDYSFQSPYANFSIGWGPRWDWFR